MQPFIITILTAAAVQSFAKLALLPRRWQLLAAALTVPLPFLFEERIARISLVVLEGHLNSAERLEQWCALVVIQEFAAVIAGFHLLSHFEAGERIPKWNYFVFLPSLLVAPGALYLQCHLYNHIPQWEFRSITWLMAGAIPLAGLLVAELVRLLRRNREERIVTVLHFEWFLLLPAIFMPVAASARLAPAKSGGVELDSLPAIGLLALPVLFSFIFLTIYRICKGKIHGLRHPNT